MTGSSEMLVDIERTTRRYIPEDMILLNFKTFNIRNAVVCYARSI
jgi:hypothetical protein